ncbi:MAG TPA: acyltransferase, partial [Candidatus Dormibacteraeota bacterium]|nr:acyltransferase [Candidatus Dormibacteraeota bacterium]
LRAVAALGVLASHVPTTSPLSGVPDFVVKNMATGVALFFVISGFLLYRPFAASLTDRSRVSIRRFAMNRALRILPLYLLVVGVVFVATVSNLTQPVFQLVRAVTFTGVYSGNDLVPVAWSLDDEAAFYVLLPLLYLAVLAWPRIEQRWWLSIAAIAALGTASVVMLAATPADHAIVGTPITKFHLFGLGMVLATLHARWPSFQVTPRLLAAGGVAAVGLLTASSFAYIDHQYVFNPLCGLAFFAVVGMVAFSPPAARLTRILSWRPLVHLGDVSYGIYLWHEPLHHVLFNSGVLSSVFVVGLLELACGTVALATGTYFLVEKPALRLKGRWIIANTKAIDRTPAASRSRTGSIYT